MTEARFDPVGLFFCVHTGDTRPCWECDEIAASWEDES